MSFYYVLSREPHPGFYGFSQPDTLDMRKEYTQLAMAEMSSDIPWIIDDMKNTLQQTYGGMPNPDFIIDSDGTLLESREWADPDKIKEFLEKRFGPSGISEQEWEELGARDMTSMAVGNNDEVPMSELPVDRVHDLSVTPVGAAKDFPYSLKVATLPPGITPEGQSRLYLTLIPDTEQAFKLAEPITVKLADVKGIKFIKDQLQSGRSRRGDDTNPHSLGILWSLEGQADQMEFTASVITKTSVGETEPQEAKAQFNVAGKVPEVTVLMDEISQANFPGLNQMKALDCKAEDSTDTPMTMEVYVKPDPSNGGGMIYFVMKIDGKGGHKWNNLATPPDVKLKSAAGIVLEKNDLYGGTHEGDGDKEDRILAVKYSISPGTDSISFEAEPSLWICHDEEGWCRLFKPVFNISGKI